MMTEEISRIGALLEQVQHSVSVIAEGHGVLYQRFDEMTARFDRIDVRFDQMEMTFNVRFDRLEGRVDRLESSVGRLEATSARLETKVDVLEGFAVDARRRLEHIETHLEQNHSHHAAASPETSTGASPGCTEKS